MADRKNIFVIHSWDEAHTFARMKDLLSARDAGLADYSVPPWKAVEGSDEEVASSIRSRIASASAVVVLNTPGLHQRPWSTFEMECAVEMGKQIIVLQPHDDSRRPIPSALNDHLYRVVSWRSDVLGRAIRGEYPQDERVFEIAEHADQRVVVQNASIGVGAVSLVLLGGAVAGFKKLSDELAAQGVSLQWTPQATGAVVKFGAGGALLAGLLTALLTKNPQAALWAAAAGGLAGAAVGGSRVYLAAQNEGNRRILPQT